MTLSEMLRDPFVAAADPIVLTGAEGLDGVVRWVHASEQLDVAPLLLGGEVLLMEGVHLRGALSDEQCHSYVESLVTARIAALAIELNDRLPTVPAAMLAAAGQAGLPLVALRRRVPFVQICQSVNTRLSDGSLHRLRLADRLSIALADAAEGARDVAPLLEVIASHTRAEVTLVGPDGAEIAHAGTGTGTEVFAGSFSCALCAGTTVFGTLLLRARTEADIHSVAVALDRAPEVLTITLLQVRPPRLVERLTADLFALLTRDPAHGVGSPDAVQVEVYLDRLGLAAESCYLTVGADIGGDRRRLREIRDLARHVAPDVLLQLAGDELLGVLPFASPQALEAARVRLLWELPAGGRPSAGITCVGTGVRRRRDLARDVTAVRTVRTWLPRPVDVGVVDARSHAVARLVRAVRDQPDVPDFVDEVLGRLTSHDDLVRTLSTYASRWGSKTATATALGISRQTLYERLKRIEEIVGPLEGSPARATAIMTAAFVEQARRSLPRESR